MTELRADAAGFLVGGQPVKPTGREASMLQRLHADMQAIRTVLTRRGKRGTDAGVDAPPGPQAGQVRTTAHVATPAPRTSVLPAGLGRLLDKVSGPVAEPAQRVMTVEVKPVQAEGQGQGQAKRDASRFVTGGVIAEPAPRVMPAIGKDGAGKNEPHESLSKTALSLVGAIKTGIAQGGGGGDAGEMDPSIKAAQEVAGIAGGAMRGISALGGMAGKIATPNPRQMPDMPGMPKDKAPTPWFRRFFNELRGFRKQESVFNKAEMRVLNKIEGKEAVPGQAGGGGGVLGMLSGLIGPAIGGAMTVAATGAVGLLKRVPVLGAILSAVGAGVEVFGSETDQNLTRAEKDKKTGGALGGATGVLAGAFGGAKAGALVGALGGPIAAAIGGVVGGVAGAFFGQNAGNIVGETVGGWVTDLRAADLPGKMMTAWTSLTDSLKAAWGKTVTPAVNAAKERAAEVTLPLKQAFARTTGTAISLSDAEANLARKNFAASDPRRTDGAQAQKPGAVEKVAERIGTGAGVIANVAGRFTGGKRKAAETAQNYAAGDIAGLDDAHTRALVASTALTESGGGKLDITNKQGYMGRYQAGASWLASAGLMRGGDKSVKAAMAADGFKNEWKWAESGGMSRFLGNDANWIDGMSREKYLSSAGAQDMAFKTASSKTYADLSRRGVIKPGDSQEVIAGYLKSAHLAGAGGAIAVSKGGQGASDANGTSARKYFDDVAKDKDGFVQAFRGASPGLVPAMPTATIAGPAAIPPLPATSVVPDKIPDLQTVLQAASKTAQAVPQRPTVVVTGGGKQMAGRDLSDRKIAHVATGGLSGG